ncbi:MAG TPA: hypothetical protein VL283_00835 [Candidatus Baltobacteraceae bacterium]|jgi:hypothetical protein|nr:hypothetical protein [Candidatus Baltobacteraceae bacterium]
MSTSSGRITARSITILMATLLAVTGLASAYLLATRGKAAQPSAKSAVESSTGLDVKQCPGGVSTRSCLLDILRAKAEADGPEAAFVDLKSLYDTDQTAHGFCHQLAHEIGHAGYKKYGSVAQAFEHGDSFCWSGYHHGVLESYVQEIGIEELPGRLSTVCDGVPGKESYTFGYFNCVHGLGHGLMAVTGDKVIEALKYCDGLPRSWDRDSCYGGVFMQNVINEDLQIHTPDFKEGDPYYPCDAVDQKYKDSCYRMQTSHMLKVMKRDFSAIFAACAETPDKSEIDVCYTSLGRDASGSTVSDIAKTREICLLGKDARGREGCIIGAVKDFISFHHSDVQAKEFCGTLEDAALKATCLQTADEYYAVFEK